MKKSIKTFRSMAALLCLCLLSGCGKNIINDTELSRIQGVTEGISDIQKEKKQIVCTIFPIYDWVTEILGKKQQDYEVVLLMESGGDLHNYQPTVMDMAKIAGCDLFFYVGGESDAWVEDALSDKKNPQRQEFALLDMLGENALEEEEVITEIDYVNRQKKQKEAKQKKDNHIGQEADHEADEHIWLSLKNAQILITEIEKIMEGFVPEASDSFRENAEKYLKEIGNLDREYETAIREGRKDTLLVCDRFPFRYLAEDYDLAYYAAFSGCGAEADASFKTIAFLSGKADELELHTVLVLENTDQKVAKTVIRNTRDKNQEILILDSMQSDGKKRLENGESYLSVMSENLEILRKALK